MLTILADLWGKPSNNFYALNDRDAEEGRLGSSPIGPTVCGQGHRVSHKNIDDEPAKPMEQH